MPSSPAGDDSSPTNAGAGPWAAEERLQEAREVLKRLVETYGVSGSEGPVREALIGLLPDWAEPRVDEAGNLHVRVGSSPPLVLFITHLDEIGYAVTAIRDDGLLELEPRGGFYGSLFEGEPALVHTAGGTVPAVFVPAAALTEGASAGSRRGANSPSGGRSGGRPSGGEPAAGARGVPGSGAWAEVRSGTGAPLVWSGAGTPQFRSGLGAPQEPAAPLADPGTRSRAATEGLGIRPGDTVTMPKELVSLAGTRVSGRSLDDRVGCAAQVLALRRLDPQRLPHAVELIWSTREEVGLEGAQFAAARLAPERPARVHAVDTFVSSDAPLESRAFAYAPLGGGAVIRAVDNSAVAPPALVDSLLALARERQMPLRAGTTGGGNDGSAFVPYGVPDVAIGWPLRYSHSPVEVADLRDIVALTDIIQAIAERW